MRFNTKNLLLWILLLSTLVLLIGCHKDPIPATINLNEISSADDYNFIANAIISDDGNSDITVRGICWDTIETPTIQDNVVNSETIGIGEFTCNFCVSEPNTTYYVRAFAVTEAGVAYSNQKTFVSGTALPVLTTADLSKLKSTSAISGGNIVSDNGSSVTSRGVCWSNSHYPTIADNKTLDGSGSGDFTSQISGLTVSTTYYVRAYATNENGTAYGNELSFTTPVFYVGKSYQGGIVAYIDETGLHGLIAAPYDLATTTWYDGAYTSIGATGVNIGTGQMNTNIIVAAYGNADYAAYNCDSYSNDGYSDWYLPSIDEMNELYKAKDEIGNFNNSGVYWSSTEWDASSVWDIDFNYGQIGNAFKTSERRVRPVRSY